MLQLFIFCIVQRKPKWSTGSSPGQQRKNYSKILTPPPQLPEKQGNRRNSRPELPIQDPPWLKKKTQSDTDDRLNKPCPLPVQDPPWLKKKSESVDDRPSKPNKPLPSPPSHDPPWMKKSTSVDDRLNKPCPLPPSQDPPWSKKKMPSDQPDGGSRGSKPLPKTPPMLPQKTKGRDARFSSYDSDNSPPPPPPERGSSKRDLFEETPPKVAPKSKSRQPAGKKPVPPPVKPKSPPPTFDDDDDDDDDDFPTADQYKKKFAYPSSLPTTRSPYYRDSIDNRPPIPPPKQVSGYHYR